MSFHRGRLAPECGLIGDRREYRRALIYCSIYISKDPERQKLLAEQVRKVEGEISELRKAAG